MSVANDQLAEGSPEHRKLVASFMLNWLTTLKAADPTAARLVDRLFVFDATVTLAIIAEGLGQSGFDAAPPTGAELDLGQFLRQEAGDLAGQQPAQVVLGQVWFFPQSPGPGEDFQVCWDEQNGGGRVTGPYKSLIRISGRGDRIIDSSSLEPGESAQREAELPGLEPGVHGVWIASPWLGDDKQNIASAAGITGWQTAEVAIGEQAAGQMQSQQNDLDIAEALVNAVGYAGQFAASAPEQDLHPLAWALQSAASLVPDPDELLTKATMLTGYDPGMIGSDVLEPAREEARLAFVALTGAQTDVATAGSSPVGHPGISQAAQKLVAAADIIIAAT